MLVLYGNQGSRWLTELAQLVTQLAFKVRSEWQYYHFGTSALRVSVVPQLLLSFALFIES